MVETNQGSRPITKLREVQALPIAVKDNCPFPGAPGTKLRKDVVEAIWDKKVRKSRYRELASGLEKYRDHLFKLLPKEGFPPNWFDRWGCRACPLFSFSYFPCSTS
jgi:hypothetical protein